MTSPGSLIVNDNATRNLKTSDHFHNDDSRYDIPSNRPPIHPNHSTIDLHLKIPSRAYIKMPCSETNLIKAPNQTTTKFLTSNQTHQTQQPKINPKPKPKPKNVHNNNPPPPRLPPPNPRHRRPPHPPLQLRVGAPLLRVLPRIPARSRDRHRLRLRSLRVL
jgi:hypothetical protein